MDYAKAIRIARALADIPQRELAARISIDASLISMLESGKRKPSLETLEKIAAAIEIPFHLFALLGAEPEDARNVDSGEVNQLAAGLTRLLLRGDGNAPRKPPTSEHSETQHPERERSRSKDRIHSRKAS